MCLPDYKTSNLVILYSKVRKEYLLGLIFFWNDLKILKCRYKLNMQVIAMHNFN